MNYKFKPELVQRVKSGKATIDNRGDLNRRCLDELISEIWPHHGASGGCVYYFHDFSSGSCEGNIYNTRNLPLIPLADFILPEIDLSSPEFKAEKPPLGLMPEKIWIEQRVSVILGAMQRYVSIGKQIPGEWVTELQGHINNLESK